MWSQLQFCLLVGLAFASNSPAFKENTEYTYNVLLRTFSSFHDLGNEYLGLVIKAKLTILSGSGTTLQAKLTNVQYAELHTHLADWLQPLPDSQLSYKPLEFCEQPFEILMHNGVVRNLIVSRQLKNWELNIIKGIVSQFQLDTNGANLINDDINTPLSFEDNSAVYKTIEDTVTGTTETLYDIHPLSGHTLLTEPWLTPLRELNSNGQLIEIIKTKNYNRSMEALPYHQGFYKMEYPFEPFSNQIGDFFYRATLSRAILTGNLKRYTIQSSVTHDEIVVSPTFANHQKASVKNFLNITIVSVQSQNGKFEINDPLPVGNLVYSYNEPLADSNKVHAPLGYQQDNLEYDSELLRQFKRDSTLLSDQPQEYQPRIIKKLRTLLPELNEAPQSPLLPLTVGYHGLSIKSFKNIVDIVEKLSRRISEQLKYPNQLLEESMLGQFIKLVSLVRTMNEQEMLRVADDLYTKELGEKLTTWKVFRDAVAQAGTGPSLLTIRKLIETDKIFEDEAAQLIFIMARATRQPTEKYMRTFFQMMKNPQIMRQAYLNESVLYSFTNLCRKVYVDRKSSHDNYPIHVFGNFNTRSGLEFLENEVIPFLSKQLDRAIQLDCKQDIHSYIFALRNVGHEKILYAFEPYLEGKKQASQVQRVLMVLGLEYLVENKPLVAQNVLYRIYQNAAENDLVRSLAVYLLVHTHPSASLLQRMADYSNVDKNEQVNAAVQTLLLNAALLKGEQYEDLRLAAKSALPYLTKKQYGEQDFKKQLLQFVSQELDESYKKSTITFGGRDQFIPNGFLFNLGDRRSGMGHHYFKAQSIVSSINTLFSVWEQQTNDYLKHQQEQQEQNQPWSSKRIAKLLGLKVHSNEQLEGMLYMHSPLLLLEDIISFDNQTIENLPAFVEHLEEIWKNGKDFHYNKFMNNHEYTIALPTIAGFPFIFTYDNPIVYKFDGEFKLIAIPPLSANHILSSPEKLLGRLTLRAMVSGKVQSRIGFITPFNGHQYGIGYDKNIHFDLPVNINAHINVKDKNLNLQLELLKQANEPNFKFIHFSTWPYTYKEDLLTLTEKRQTITTVSKQQKYSTTFGLEQTGIALKLEGKADELPSLKELFLNMNQGLDSLYYYLNVYTNDKIQSSEHNFKFDSQRSLTKRIDIVLSYRFIHGREFEHNSYQELYELPEDFQRKREGFFKGASANIENSDTYIYDVVVGFNGDNYIKYVAKGLLSKSNVDPESELLFTLLKTDKYTNKSYSIFASAKSHIPNTNGLDMDYAIEFDPTSTTHVYVVFGEEQETRLNLLLKGTKTEQRKQYLKQLPQYHECKIQEQQGNRQLPICANMTVQANLLDHLTLKLNYHSLDTYLVNQTYKFYSLARYFLYPYVDENIFAPVLDNNELKFEMRFDPSLTKLTALMQTASGLETLFNNVKINDWFKQILVPHPVYHVKSRLTGKLLGYDIYRPYCVVDKTAVSTFEQLVFPATFYPDWTLMLLYVPESDFHRQSLDIGEQFDKQIEHYAVLTRASNDMYKKELKITVQTPKTKGQYVEILLKPSFDKFKVFVNGAEVKVSQKQSTDLYGGYLQIYGLPNNELKVELSNDFYILYDGTRARLSVMNGKFRGSVRGICGAFEEKTTALQNPEGCILNDPKQFIESYTITKQNHLQPKHQHKQCFRKEQFYVDVITNNDFNRHEEQLNGHNPMCTKHQTRYVENGDKVCFTLRPVPVCKTGCAAKLIVSKKVPVHCVKDNLIIRVWKKQIDNGGSPSFSHKSETTQLLMELPQECSY